MAPDVSVGGQSSFKLVRAILLSNGDPPQMYEIEMNRNPRLLDLTALSTEFEFEIRSLGDSRNE